MAGHEKHTEGEGRIGQALTAARLYRERLDLLVAVHSQTTSGKMLPLICCFFGFVLSLVLSGALAQGYEQLGRPWGLLEPPWFFYPTLAVVLPLAVMLGIWGFRSAARQREQKLAGLAAKFPNDVSRWGGIDNLRDLNALKSVIALERKGGPPRTPEP